MILNEKAFEVLAARTDEFEAGRSSHWRHEQNSFNFTTTSFEDVGPLGTYSTSAGLVPSLAHFIFQIPFRLRGLAFRSFFQVDLAARRVAKRQGRQYDLDLLRHVFTLALLKIHSEIRLESEPICIVGDGYGNMASVILENLPQARVVLVNLNKSLLVDLICIRKAFPEEDYVLVRTDKEYTEALETDSRIFAVGANDAAALLGKIFSIFINIESMMEMDPGTIKQYFDIIRSVPSPRVPFYCCNQEYKNFSGEGKSNFYDYPWLPEDNFLVDEVCSWTKLRYGNTFPFFRKRRPDLHRLALMKTVATQGLK